MFYKRGVLRNFTKFTGKYLCQSLFLKETLAQVFSSEFCEISKNTFFAEHLWVNASRDIQNENIELNSVNAWNQSHVIFSTGKR